MKKQILTIGAVVSWTALAIGLASTAWAAGGGKVGVCHIPPGNPDNAHIISVAIKAVPAHIRDHGDEIQNRPPAE